MGWHGAFCGLPAPCRFRQLLSLPWSAKVKSPAPRRWRSPPSRRFALVQRLGISLAAPLRGVAPAASQRCCESLEVWRGVLRNCHFSAMSSLCTSLHFGRAYTQRRHIGRAIQSWQRLQHIHIFVASRESVLRRRFKCSQVRLNLNPFQPPQSAEAHPDKPSATQRLQTARAPGLIEETARK